MAVEDQRLIADAQNEDLSTGGWRRASGPLVLGLLGSNLLFLGVCPCRMILDANHELWLSLFSFFVWGGKGGKGLRIEFPTHIIVNVDHS